MVRKAKISTLRGMSLKKLKTRWRRLRKEQKKSHKTGDHSRYWRVQSEMTKTSKIIDEKEER